MPSPVLGARSSSASRTDRRSELSLFWSRCLARVPSSSLLCPGLRSGCRGVTDGGKRAVFLAIRPARTLNSNPVPTRRPRVHTSEKPAAADVNQRANQRAPRRLARSLGGAGGDGRSTSSFKSQFMWATPAPHKAFPGPFPQAGLCLCCFPSLLCLCARVFTASFMSVSRLRWVRSLRKTGWGLLFP